MLTNQAVQEATQATQTTQQQQPPEIAQQQLLITFSALTISTEPARALDTLPDDVLQQIISACTKQLDIDIGLQPAGDIVPRFEAVKGLGCSKALRQQLHQLRPLVAVESSFRASPLVAVESLAVVQRPAHGPWRVTLLYNLGLTEAVIELARQGCVRSIVLYDEDDLSLAPAVARRVVPDLLGAGCSLLTLTLDGSELNDTWAAIFGEAAVCSAALRELSVQDCGLRGAVPELMLPALQGLNLSGNKLRGELVPLRRCTALQMLCCAVNQLSGGLEPLQNFTALQRLILWNNQLTGGLEPLRGCTALQILTLGGNRLTGGLEPLQGCTALQVLQLENNFLTGGLEPLRGCQVLQDLVLTNNNLTGGLEPLRGWAELPHPHYLSLYLDGNHLDCTDEDKDFFKRRCGSAFVISASERWFALGLYP